MSGKQRAPLGKGWQAGRWVDRLALDFHEENPVRAGECRTRCTVDSRRRFEAFRAMIADRELTRPGGAGLHRSDRFGIGQRRRLCRWSPRINEYQPHAGRGDRYVARRLLPERVFDQSRRQTF